MCGILGYIDSKPNYAVKDITLSMAEAISSRGPDSFGIWQDENLGINFAHRRLAILDLTPAGHQPMVSDDGRFIIVFNGEIYNFQKLKHELDNIDSTIVWRGHSDTEVLLQGFVVWGIEKTIIKCEGMFAIALWDRHDKRLYLIRDRMGEKPLYYGYFNGVFGFASELKAFKPHPRFHSVVNHDALGQLLLHNCIPAPLSIYTGISKLMPAHILTINYEDMINQKMPQSNAYWSLNNYLSRNYAGSLNDSINDLELLLKDVVKSQMVADVPLGSFLSGGIDSSLITSIMQSLSGNPIKTFSIGFDNPEYDEAIFAKNIAKHLGTDHQELYVTEKDALQVIPLLPTIYDEPFSDSSQIPTYLVAKLARTKVTVSLSGDAGDELFAGYNRYLLYNSTMAKFNKIPYIIRYGLAKTAMLLSPTMMSNLNKILKFPIPNFSDKFYKLSGLLKSKSFDEFYLVLISHWLNFSKIVKNSKYNGSYWIRELHGLQGIEAMMYLDSLGYMPDDILVKVDRAAMANSLESRVPFLNHRVVEFANSLPLDYKINNNISKYILRQVLYRYIPQNLIERPKRGFAMPVNQWLRGDLKDWAYALLDPVKLNNQGFLNSEFITEKLTKHISGKENNGYYLWDVLMFQQWLEYNK